MSFLLDLLKGRQSPDPREGRVQPKPHQNRNNDDDDDSDGQLPTRPRSLLPAGVSALLSSLLPSTQRREGRVRQPKPKHDEDEVEPPQRSREQAAPSSPTHAARPATAPTTKPPTTSSKPAVGLTADEQLAQLLGSGVTLQGGERAARMTVLSTLPGARTGGQVLVHRVRNLPPQSHPIERCSLPPLPGLWPAVKTSTPAHDAAFVTVVCPLGVGGTLTGRLTDPDFSAPARLAAFGAVAAALAALERHFPHAAVREIPTFAVSFEDLFDEPRVDVSALPATHSGSGHPVIFICEKGAARATPTPAPSAAPRVVKPHMVALSALLLQLVCGRADDGAGKGGRKKGLNEGMVEGELTRTTAFRKWPRPLWDELMQLAAACRCGNSAEFIHASTRELLSHFTKLNQEVSSSSSSTGPKRGPKAKPKASCRQPCVVCMDRVSGVRLVPCGHDEFCVRCVVEMSPKLCPLCRAAFTTFVMLQK